MRVRGYAPATPCWAERPGEPAEGLTYTEWTLEGRVLAGLTLMDEP